jgi:hypothetical protein
MREPWFTWSFLHGIKPIHAYGWAFLSLWIMLSLTLALVALGEFKASTLIRMGSGVSFIGTCAAFAWIVFRTFDRRSQSR